MVSGVRTAVTLAVLAILVVGGAMWGWAQLIKPFPGRTELPVCVDTAYKAGDSLYPSQVVVSVLNAGTREGLAGRTMSQLMDQGFVQGTSGNAPAGTKVSRVQVWAADPASPAVKLLQTRLGQVKVVPREVELPGVVVVVGDDFTKPKKGPKSVEVAKDATVCSPPA